ncbi:MAG: TnsA endonuclease N-terminal domain-containing protein [Candidatus Competibacteraceae bacterium]|jgi:hypothetical protein|nr:TnsA endonuclease N-terminal domain-containing protein [Candidatus Competibacteraceae bacterium]
MNYLSVTGRVPSQKMARLVAYESPLERDFYLMLEFDRGVDYYEEQPLAISYQHPTVGKRTYTPDVLVRYFKDKSLGGPRAPELFEIKPRDELRRNWTDFKPKFKAARRYARKKGWRFIIVTEREIRTPYLDNAKFLMRYIHDQPNYERENVLLEMMADLRESDPETLIAAIFSDRMNKARLIPSLWRLIGCRAIGVDLTRPLTMQSRIWEIQE